ncbi:MAG: GNAT family N-acetyltransferase [Pyrinomonadaceae bacterium]
MRQNKADIQIRLAVPEDASRVASVLHESFVEYEASYTQEAFAATAPTSEQIRSRMMEGPMWVALRDGVIVGTASAVSRGEALYIRGMAVAPSARGEGMGRLLLEHSESFASAHGYRSLILSTTPFLHSAIQLYERYGFRCSTEGPHELFGTPIFTMVKSLEASD